MLKVKCKQCGEFKVDKNGDCWECDQKALMSSFIEFVRETGAKNREPEVDAILRSMNALEAAFAKFKADVLWYNCSQEQYEDARDMLFAAVQRVQEVKRS